MKEIKEIRLVSALTRSEPPEASSAVIVFMPSFAAQFFFWIELDALCVMYKIPIILLTARARELYAQGVAVHFDKTLPLIIIPRPDRAQQMQPAEVVIVQNLDTIVTYAIQAGIIRDDPSIVKAVKRRTAESLLKNLDL
ncbi:MAG: hypothetical protein KatS3mg087_1333 [Patescibacteria group bacterium]|nr:MAG: hypothetical protein KatS3mg087_1333 [Patescibacteria group bacterium]